MKITKINDSLYSLNVPQEDAPDLVFNIKINDQVVYSDESKRSYVFWDLFESQDMHIYIPNNHKLSLEITTNLKTVFKNFYLKKPSLDNFHFTDINSYHCVTWAQFYEATNPRMKGWLLPFALFFKSEVDYSRAGFCDSFTGLISDKMIISKSYPYANFFPAHTCSHPGVRPKDMHELAPAYCVYSSNQTECPFYSSTHEVIASRQITSYGTQEPVFFNLNYFSKLDGSTQYQIVCLPEDTVNYTMTVDHRTDETDSRAIEVLNEIVSAFDDGFKNISERESAQHQKSQKPSYIMSLA